MVLFRVRDGGYRLEQKAGGREREQSRTHPESPLRRAAVRSPDYNSRGEFAGVPRRDLRSPEGETSRQGYPTARARKPHRRRPRQAAGQGVGSRSSVKNDLSPDALLGLQPKTYLRRTAGRETFLWPPEP